MWRALVRAEMGRQPAPRTQQQRRRRALRGSSLARARAADHISSPALRGPFASYFVWRGESPTLLVGGGSGVVPLMCMLRHRRRTKPDTEMRLLYSVRDADDVIYANELGDKATLAFTGTPPSGWDGHTGRIEASFFPPGTPETTVYICGSNGFVLAAERLAMEAGYAPERIRTERFGPTS